MELPPYRIPSLRDALLHTWERASMYLRKAGTIVLGITILLWALTSFPTLPADKSGNAPDRAASLAHSFAGRAGHWMEPMLAPMGFDWKIGTALVGAFAAKEVFVAQMGIVYAVGDEEEAEVPLRQKLKETYSPLVGLCIMLFALIGSPCMVTGSGNPPRDRSLALGAAAVRGPHGIGVSGHRYGLPDRTPSWLGMTS